ncbi:nitroreductase family protein [Ilyobacter polytropus]|uniref:Nitroreductase n=1 Tax=Ilyobacter polytropus (strain ATCC 51220 / DSM 2926 / LMG 16218 / CuHBu1) TaxID=572544 RepID=E3H6R2_ILYPC|nr:nitroreductase family protein [Ilyobacter polytropus]ADO82431.1 nitroreductase [Ilyobacter polytropus DSM 2926]
MNKILEVIKNRRSTRSYKEEQVKKDEIMALLEAGAWAPSGHNKQPWQFTVVQNKELIKKMSDRSKYTAKDAEKEKMRKMANNPDFNIFHKAPTVIIVSHKNDAITPLEDISAATENILLQAESMGLGTCWSAFIFGIFRGPEKEEFIKYLEILEGHTLHHAIAVGYPNAKVFNYPERKNDYFNFIK